MNAETIEYLINFRREVLSQVLVAATIFGAFSIGGAIAILASPYRSTTFRVLLFTLSLSSLAFILATSFDVVLLATLKNDMLKRLPEKAHEVIRLANVVTYSVMAGTFGLVLSISLFGFGVSKRLGWLIFLLSAMFLMVFIGLCVHLHQLLK